MGIRKGGVECKLREKGPFIHLSKGQKRARGTKAVANHISPSQNGPFHLPFATQHKEMSSKLRQELNECGFVIVQHLLLL